MTYFYALVIGVLLGFVIGYAVRPSQTRTVHVISNLPRGVAIATAWRNKHWN